MGNNRFRRQQADSDMIGQCQRDLGNLRSDIQKISVLLNLAGNETRLKILYLIYQEDRMCPCDLAEILDMTVPAVSQQLRKMKDGKILDDKKSGQVIFYSLNIKAAGVILPVLNRLIASGF